MGFEVKLKRSYLYLLVTQIAEARAMEIRTSLYCTDMGEEESNVSGYFHCCCPLYVGT